MKAYSVYLNDEEERGIDIAFANSNKEAIKKVFNHEGVFNDIEDLDAEREDFIHLRANRTPYLDGLENKSPESIAYKLIKDHDWTWGEDGERTVTQDNIDQPKIKALFHSFFEDVEVNNESI